MSPIIKSKMAVAAILKKTKRFLKATLYEHEGIKKQKCFIRWQKLTLIGLHTMNDS
jgi:hypothetical protein